MISRTISVSLFAIGMLAAVPALAADQAVCGEAKERFNSMSGDIDMSGADHIILMYKYTFCPDRLTVKKGETITWVNVDKRTSHSFWLIDLKEPESDRLFSMETGSYTATKLGEHRVLCGPHWEKDEMIGYINVVE